MDTIPALECHRYLGARASPVRGLVPRRRGLFFLFVSFFPSFAYCSSWPCTTPACIFTIFQQKKIRLKVMWPPPRASAKAFLRLPRRCTGKSLFCRSSVLTFCFLFGSFFLLLKLGRVCMCFQVNEYLGYANVK